MNVEDFAWRGRVLRICIYTKMIRLDVLPSVHKCLDTWFQTDKHTSAFASVPLRK